MVDRTKLAEGLLAATQRKADRQGLKRYSQHQLATDVGTAQPYLSRVMRGQAMPSRDMLLRLCRALECSTEEAAEIFSHTDYRAPTDEELEDEDSHVAA